MLLKLSIILYWNPSTTKYNPGLAPIIWHLLEMIKEYVLTFVDVA